MSVELPMDPEDLTKGLCRCGAATRGFEDGAPPTCGYDSEIRGVETPCNCCHECARSCAEDI
jgi:hypothetical protein